MHGSRTGLIVAVVFLCVFAASYAFLQFRGHLSSAPLSAEIEPAPADSAAAPPPPAPAGPTPADPAPEEFAAVEPAAGAPDLALPPAASADPAGGGVPMAPGTTESSNPSPEFGSARDGVAMPPAAHDPAPSAMPPAAHDPAPLPAPAAMPPAAAGDPPTAAPPTATPVVRRTAAKRDSQSGSKVLSYFQHTRTQVDTAKAFGFVLMPRVAVTSDERDVQKQFCEIMLATMDFMTPGAAAARSDILVTYWPIVAAREPFEIKAAFTARDCGLLITWYDHKIARSLATKAGVADLTGPLLITWPSSGAEGQEARNPLIVDFSKADHERATKALQYWFRQLRAKPELWTNRIREGTIRAELADAVNDTAGVMLAVLYGKWDSLNTVSATP